MSWKGIFAIPQTPFEKNDAGFMEVDDESLRREINFCLEAGAHGLVMPVMASEFQVLSYDERLRIAEVVVQECEGRIPVVIGVSGVNTRMAVFLSRHAERVGADAVIAMPPYVSKLSRKAVYNHFKAISDSVEIPIFVQNASPPLGSALPPDFVAKLVKEIENVKYVKEEVPPIGHSISAVLKACGDDVQGVFGGFGGRYMIEELRRGAAGNMPACHFTDILVEIYERYQRGDEAGAKLLHQMFLPVTNLTVGAGSIVKEVLKLRGIFKTTFSRVQRPALDEIDIEELRIHLNTLQPYFKVHPPRIE